MIIMYIYALLLFYFTVSIVKFQFKSLRRECSWEENVEVSHLHHPVKSDQVDGHVWVELC